VSGVKFGSLLAAALLVACATAPTRAAPAPEASATPQAAPSATPAISHAGSQRVDPQPGASPLSKPKTQAKPKTKAVGKAPAKKKPKSDSSLSSIEAKYKKAGSVSAKFTQTNYTAATSQTKVSQGTLQAKPPGKIRWETLSPDANLLISDGRKIWFYTPPFDPADPSERGQLIERPAGQIEARLAQTLVTGALSSTGIMSIERVNESNFALRPLKKVRTSILKAVVEIDVAKLLIVGVTLEHKGGNTSEIRLTDIELGQKLPDSTFVFKAPANTDRVDPE
jgi:outer membrane lipoprotein carrier protein